MILHIALHWLSLGIPPIPCRAKRPSLAWKRYQTILPSESLIRQWFSRSTDLALITGWQGLTVLDFDDVPTYAHWIIANPTLTKTYTVQTRRGYHAYFYIDETSDGPPHILNVDIQANRRRLVVAPPSTGYVANDAPIMRLAHIDEAINGLKVIESAPSCLNTEFLSSPVSRHDFIGHIKAALPIVALLSRYTSPYPSDHTGRWWTMRCPHPDHPDRHPSFWADSKRGVCGCLKSKCRATQPQGRSMDIFNLYSWLHGVGNQRAILVLASEV